MLKKVTKGYGDVMRSGTGLQFRITFHTHDKREAEARQAELCRVRDALVKLGRGKEAKGLMLHAAKHAASDEGFAVSLSAAGELPEPEPAEYTTIRELGEAWTTGELARKYRDLVPAKKSSKRDGERLAYLYEVVGAIPLKAFTKKDFIKASTAIPATAERPAARKHYLQALRKVLNIAVKLDLVEQNPVPEGMMPVVVQDKQFTWLYPAEDRALLACVEVPLVWRALWGFLDREGCRFHEAAGTPWGDIDFAEGTITVPPERTKNGRGLHWSLHPATLAALRHLATLTKVGPFEGIDADEDKASELLNGHLRLAGLTRKALLESTPSRQRLRAHDLRSTFITLALMAGRSESWITDRTGHRSSGQIRNYDHWARTAGERNLGQLDDLDLALGLRKPVVVTPDPDPQPPEGVTKGVTIAAPEGASLGGLASETSMIAAGWPLPGSNRHAFWAGDFKAHGDEHDEQKAAVNEAADCTSAPDATGCHTQTGPGVTTAKVIPCGSTSSPNAHLAATDAASKVCSPEHSKVAPAEAYAAALRAAAHAAIEAGDYGAVAELGRLAKAAAGNQPATAQPVAPAATEGKASAPVIDLGARRRS